MENVEYTMRPLSMNVVAISEPNEAPVIFEAVEAGIKGTFKIHGWSTYALVSFGTYLLSPEREENLRQTNIELPEALPYEDRFRHVYDADIANWKHQEEEKRRILEEGVVNTLA